MENENERIEDPEYLVTWTIDMEASCARGAAEKAHCVLVDLANTATVFTVFEKHTGKTFQIDTAEINGTPTGFNPSKYVENPGAAMSEESERPEPFDPAKRGTHPAIND